MLYTGVDLLTLSRVTEDSPARYSADKPIELPVSSIDFMEQGAFNPVYKDGKERGAFAVGFEPSIKINTKAISPDLLSGILNSGEEPALFDSGLSKPSYYALGFRVKKNNGSYDYCNHLKGVIEVAPKDVNVEGAVVESLTFKPMTTEHVFDYNGKPCRSLVVNNTAKDVTPAGWLSRVWTPDNLLPVPAPAVDLGEAEGGAVAVTMRAVRSTDVVRYTTDGTTPTLESPVYTAPLAVPFGSVIRAIECAECNNVSPVTTALAIQKCAMPQLVIKCETPIITIYGELVIYV